MSGETFGSMLRRLRTERGYSQNGLARRAGVDPAYVNQIERGKRTTSGALVSPSRSVVLALCDALDLAPREADRVLWVAGLAPSIDWQARAEAAEGQLGMPRDVFVFRPAHGLNQWYHRGQAGATDGTT
jgi:transcriptional regulator with XRE-family HTH domain